MRWCCPSLRFLLSISLERVSYSYGVISVVFGPSKLATIYGTDSIEMYCIFQGEVRSDGWDGAALWSGSDYRYPRLRGPLRRHRRRQAQDPESKWQVTHLVVYRNVIKVFCDTKLWLVEIIDDVTWALNTRFLLVESQPCSKRDNSYSRNILWSGQTDNIAANMKDYFPPDLDSIMIFSTYICTVFLMDTRNNNIG